VDYPQLERLVLSGCNLADRSLMPIVRAIMELPRLQELDLAGNDIDET
jgi:Leucine-rich repeat (LRR) protein